MEDMCTLGESIYYEGKDEGVLTCICKLMQTMGLSVKEAMRQLDVPEEEQAVYEEMLKEQ